MSETARKVASGSALRLVNLIGTALISVLIMPFVVHAVGDRLYGIWTLVAAFVSYYALLDLGMSSAVSRYLASALGSGDEEQCNRVFNTALLVYLGLGVAAMAVSGLLAAVAPAFSKNPEDASLLRAVILILGLSVALGFPAKVFTGVLNAHLRFDRTALLDLLSLALRTALVIAVLLGGYKVVGLAWATFFSCIPSIVLSAYFSHKDLPFLRLDSQHWGRGTATALFSYSSFSLIAQLADVLRFQVDSIVIAAFWGLAAVTHYRIASVLTQYFIELMLALLGVLPSVFSRQEGAKDQEGIRRTFFFASKISVCISTFVGFGLIAWGRPFIARWMGPQYLDAYPCLVVLVVGCIFALWQTPSVALLYGISKHKFFALFNSLEGVANLLLSLLLVRKYGIVGVALGTLIPMAITKLLIQPYYVCRVAGIDYGEYMWRAGRTLASVAVALIIPFVLSMKLAAPNYKALFSAGLLSLAFYVAFLWMYALSSREARMLQQAIWPRLSIKRSIQ